MNSPLLCGLACALALAACAGEPTTLHGADSAAIDRTCLQSTGTHIRRRSGECLPVAGRAYGEADLDRTGRTDLAEALSALDPSINVGR